MKNKKSETTKNCQNKAKFILAWGGKLYRYCEDHANELCIIGQAIGTNIDVQIIITDDYCEKKNES